MKIINTETTRNLNGGKKIYRCKVCGYRSSSYWKTFNNAWLCGMGQMGNFAMKLTNIYDICDFIQMFN